MTGERRIATSSMEISLCCPQFPNDEKLKCMATESLYDQVHLGELWNTERLANLD